MIAVVGWLLLCLLVEMRALASSIARHTASSARPAAAAVLLRHGDRAPTFNAYEGSPLSGPYTQYWASQIQPRLQHLLSNNLNPEGNFDEDKAPFGQLTALGAAQARLRGQRLRAYLQQEIEGEGFAVETVRASNFARTQQTAGHFLSGFLGESDVQQQKQQEGGASPSPSSSSQEVPIVTVKDFRTDNIAVFEAENNGLFAAAKALFSSRLYSDREQKLQAIAAELSAALPYFQPPQQQRGNSSSSGSSAPHSEYGGIVPSSRFMWIKVFDLFHCMQQHGLHLPPRLQQWQLLTERHLLWRFKTLFGSPGISKLASGSLGRELGQLFQQKARAEGWGKEEEKGEWQERHQEKDKLPVTVISGHDVTLMPMLQALLAVTEQVHIQWRRRRGEQGNNHARNGSDAVLNAAADTALQEEESGQEKGGRGGAAAAAGSDAEQICLLHGSKQLALEVMPWPEYAAALSFLLIPPQAHSEARPEGHSELESEGEGSAAASASAASGSRWTVRWRFHNEHLHVQQQQQQEMKGAQQKEGSGSDASLSHSLGHRSSLNEQLAAFFASSSQAAPSQQQQMSGAGSNGSASLSASWSLSSSALLYHELVGDAPVQKLMERAAVLNGRPISRSSPSPSSTLSSSSELQEQLQQVEKEELAAEGEMEETVLHGQVQGAVAVKPDAAVTPPRAAASTSGTAAAVSVDLEQPLTKEQELLLHACLAGQASITAAWGELPLQDFLGMWK